MGKLICRHLRMEPVPLACRAGPALAIALYLLIPSNLSAAISSGAPAKAARKVVASADRVSVTLNFAPRPENIPVVRTGYLPECGPSPLRFAEPRMWPSPLPSAQSETSAPEKNVVASDASAPAAPTGETAANDDEERPESIVISAGNPPRQRSASSDGPLLTSDLVLGYLENRPVKQGGIRTTFEPATPPEASPDAATPAATP